MLYLNFKVLKMYINMLKTKILNRSVHFIINLEFIDFCVVPIKHKYDLGIENMVYFHKGKQDSKCDS